MLQIPGSSCAKCNSRILTILDGGACEPCYAVYCRTCLGAASECPTCAAAVALGMVPPPRRELPDPPRRSPLLPRIFRTFCRIPRKPAAALLILALLVGSWLHLGRPSPGLLLRHGLPPSGGPTGRIIEDSRGNPFLEIEPGCARCEHPRWLRSVAPSFEWIEVSEPYLLAAEPVTFDEMAEYVADARRGELTAQLIPWRPAAVTWKEAQQYAVWLTKRHPGTYRLPTSAQLLLYMKNFPRRKDAFAVPEPPGRSAHTKFYDWVASLPSPHLGFYLTGGEEWSVDTWMAGGPISLSNQAVLEIKTSEVDTREIDSPPAHVVVTRSGRDGGERGGLPDWMAKSISAQEQEVRRGSSDVSFRLLWIPDDEE